MRTITIADNAPPGVPVVELAELLDLLGSMAERSEWTVSADTLCDGAGQGDGALMHLAAHPEAIDGRALRTMAHTVESILEGSLMARLPGEEQPWITVKFFDNRCVDVSTTNGRAIKTLRHRFEDVVTWAF